MGDRARPDLYVVLGVSRTASAVEVRAAYRRLIRQVHPDAGGSEERFRLVHEAYETLIDPVRRAAYDSARSGAVGGPSVPPRSPAGSGQPAAPPRASAVVDTEPASNPSSCLVAVAGAVVVIVLVVVGVIVAVGSSGPTVSSSRGSVSVTSAAPPTTAGPDAARRVWQVSARPTVEAILGNGQAIGELLSAADRLDLELLREVCRERAELLDRLEAVSPAAPADLAAAVDGFTSAERRAMSSCLASPPDIERMGEWAQRGRTDLQTIVRAVVPAAGGG